MALGDDDRGVILTTVLVAAEVYACPPGAAN